jgi:hypothetical protein
VLSWRYVQGWHLSDELSTVVGDLILRHHHWVVKVSHPVGLCAKLLLLSHHLHVLLHLLLLHQLLLRGQVACLRVDQLWYRSSNWRHKLVCGINDVQVNCVLRLLLLVGDLLQVNRLAAIRRDCRS